MKDLVKRLRWIAKYNPSTFNAETENQAANAIEKLQVELEQTRKERDTLAKELFDLAVTAGMKCDYCKNFYTISCGVCSKGSKWEWRGVEED